MKHLLSLSALVLSLSSALVAAVPTLHPPVWQYSNPPYPGAKPYVAVAFSPASGVTASSEYSYYDSNNANLDAVDECNKAVVAQGFPNYRDCRAITASYGCASIAVGANRGYGWAATEWGSADASVQNCVPVDTYCTVRVTTCAPGYPHVSP